jgi:6,7-dimethyl-8-ribityllumazine synthase
MRNETAPGFFISTMATRNLSDYDASRVPAGDGFRIGIVVAEWNWEITGAMAQGAYETLTGHGVKAEHIQVERVPGSFELTSGGLLLAETGIFDAIILIGCVIQGETRHFDFICQGVTQGAVDLSLKFSLPVIYGVLTTDNLQQALDRAGGKHGNKGDEAAITALKMADLFKRIRR